MADTEKQPDARDAVLYKNDTFTVGPHRKVKSDNSYVAVVNKKLADKYPTFMDILNAPDTKPLRDLFNAIAGGMSAHAKKHNVEESNDVFWLINVTDDRVTDKNNTHSKGSYPHTHIIYGPLPEDYEYAYVLNERTYTPDTRAKMTHGWPQFKNFQEFIQQADEEDYEGLKENLLYDLEWHIPRGGARLVCDEFNSTQDDCSSGGPGLFELRIQTGDQGHKWFERPKRQP